MTGMTGGLRQFLKFVLIGLANTALTYLIYRGLLLWLSYYVAYSISYVSGIAFSYFCNAFLVFKQAPSWRSFLSYPLVYVFQYVLSLLGTVLLVEVAHVPARYAPLFIIAVSVPVTFVLSRFIFSRSKPSDL
jgi:putative flippase GtrA